MNVNGWSPVTQLQLTTCVFGSPYAFRLIAEGLSMCLSPKVFCATYRFAVTRLLKLPCTPYLPRRCDLFDRWTCPFRMRSKWGAHKSRSLHVATDKCGSATANNDDLLRHTAALIKKKEIHKITTKYMQRQKYYNITITRRPASADRTARAANFRRDL